MRHGAACPREFLTNGEVVAYKTGIVGVVSDGDRLLVYLEEDEMRRIALAIGVLALLGFGVGVGTYFALAPSPAAAACSSC
jgi:hypothetical protein